MKSEAGMTGFVDAKVIAASIAAGVGGTTGVGVSIGIAWRATSSAGTPTEHEFTYMSNDRPATLRQATG